MFETFHSLKLMGQFLDNLLCGFFCNPENTSMAQLIAAFAFGVILSPWSKGIFFLVFFAIIYEMLLLYYTKMSPRWYNGQVRAGCIMASFLGFFIGRYAAGDDLFPNASPFDDDFSFFG